MAFLNRIARSLTEHPATLKIHGWVAPMAGSSAFPWLICGISFASTLSVGVPSVPTVCALVAIDRRRWLQFALLMAIGAGFAAITVCVAMNAWGQHALVGAFPGLAKSIDSATVREYVDQWGVIAIAAISASPLNQSIAVIAAGLLGMPTAKVAAAAFAGKLLKYGAVALLIRIAINRVVCQAPTAAR